jgi:hypothetical protein
MLEYCKLILTNNSSNKFLFVKEDRKCRKILSRNESSELRQWMNATFKDEQRNFQHVMCLAGIQK